jgi:hypothetical protein
LPYRKITASFSANTVTITWDAQNKLRQTEKDKSYGNELYLFQDPVNAEVAPIANPESGPSNKNVLKGLKLDKPNEYKLVNIPYDPTLSITLAEYECFPNNKDGLTSPEVLDKLNAVGPRDDINRRLIFSYNFLKASE